MQIKQLEALVNVIDFGSFSKAAEASYLSQPTISSHIRTLEREVGTKLVIRSTKEIYPSHAGKVLYEYAKEILKLRERAIVDLKQEISEISGTLQIAISDYPSQYFLPDFLKDFSRKYQDLSFRITNFSATDVGEAILNNQAEVGITESSIEKRNLVFEKIHDIHCVIITPNTEHYRKLKAEKTSIKDIFENSRFILCEDGSVLYQNTMRYIAELGLERRNLNVFVSMQNVNGVVEAVKNGLGVSVVPYDYLTDDESVLIFEDNSNSLHRTFNLVYHVNKPLSPAAEAFYKELKRNYITSKSGPAANI